MTYMLSDKHILGSHVNNYVRKSNGLAVNSFYNVYSFSASTNATVGGIFIDKQHSKNDIYVYAGKKYSFNKANSVVMRGKLSANSASIGPVFFGTSYGYVLSESLQETYEGFNLANVAEWPHVGGLYQMKNMVIGTLSSGKIGKSEDSIVQVKHIGSTVRIMWPRQDNNNIFVKGYGDLSVDQSIGKLSNVFDPGDFMDVTEFDHMTLYCYLQKQVSGTLDDVVIQIERKPLRNVGFTTEQVVSYSTSRKFCRSKIKRFAV
jgi:hypothetical protein